MDWNLKATSWDLTDFEQDAISSVDAFDRPTGLVDYRNRGDFSIDLKLGRIGNSSEESMNKWKQPAGVSKLESSPSVSTTKRARGANNGTQAVSCLVDGCNSDLSTCRDYHRRHKVCERHSKTPQVTIGGQKQRFCQQCSRFHSLEEFDEGKRSCRKRLDGHNRRRRKPQPDLLSRSGSYLSNYQGTQLLPFSSTHVYPSTAVANPAWSGIVSAEADARHYNLHQQIHVPDKQNIFLGFSPSSYKAAVEKQFPFLQCDNSALNNQTPPDASVCPPHLGVVSSFSESSDGSSSRSMLCDKLTTRVCESDCALSLLSSTQMQSSRNHMMRPNSVPLVQPIHPSIHGHSLESMDSVLVSSGRDADDVHWPGIFQMRSGGTSSSENKDLRTLPFNWENGGSRPPYMELRFQKIL